jgi:hypothetical protein
VPFGDVATLISSFTGADENPLSEGGNWAKVNSSDNALQRLSNAATSAAATTGTSYWTPRNFGPDVEVHVTITTLPGNGNHVIVGARIVGEGGSNTWDGYTVRFTQDAATDSVFIEKITNATSSILATISQEFAVGDKLGMRIVGSDIEAYRHDGASWSLIGSANEGTYSAAGKVLLRVRSTTGRADDFSAGSIKPGRGVVGAVGSGISVQIAQETGVGVVGAVGSGAKVFSAGTTYIKIGFATVGTLGAGTYSLTPGGGTHTKAGHGIVGTTATSTSGHAVDVVYEGIVIAFGSTTLDPYPTWTRIDQ